MFARQPRPTPTQRMANALRMLLVTVLILFGLWVPGLILYVHNMPDQVDDSHTKTDAIVVLTGGSERLHVGLDLLEQGLAPQLFVSGVYAETTLDDLLAERPFPDHLKSKIVLGYVAVDTVGNAVETAVWMRENDLSSIRLVTAAYHMPRSLLEFQAVAPQATVIPNPVFPQSVKRNDWWSYPGTAELFASEFTKYLVARLRLMVPDRPQAH